MPRQLVKPRFADFSDTRRAGAALDDFLLRNRKALVGEAEAFHVIQARSRETIRPGMMIRAVAHSSVMRADSRAHMEATGVVLNTLGETLAWSPEAIVPLKLPDNLPGGTQWLWLGPNGGVQTTKPTGGLVQRVGHTLYLDRPTGMHVCYIHPFPPEADYLCFWVHDAENKICLNQIDQTVDFTVDARVVARLDSTGRLRILGDLENTPYTSATVQVPGDSPNGLIEYNPANESISFGCFGAGDSGEVVRVAELHPDGDLRVADSRAEPTFPVAVTTRPFYYGWNATSDGLDLGYTKATAYLRFDRQTIASVVNARLLAGTIRTGGV